MWNLIPELKKNVFKNTHNIKHSLPLETFWNFLDWPKLKVCTLGSLANGSGGGKPNTYKKNEQVQVTLNRAVENPYCKFWHLKKVLDNFSSHLNISVVCWTDIICVRMFWGFLPPGVPVALLRWWHAAPSRDETVLLASYQRPADWGHVSAHLSVNNCCLCLLSFILLLHRIFSTLQTKCSLFSVFLDCLCGFPFPLYLSSFPKEPEASMTSSDDEWLCFQCLMNEKKQMLTI